MANEIGVIFDMDGVLVDSYRAHFRSWLEVAESDGLHFTEEQFAGTFGRTSREIIDHFWGQGHLSDAQIAELDRRKEAAYRRLVQSDFPAMPGATQLLRSLSAAGFRLAVGSSGPPENVNLALEKLAVGDLFHAVVTGEDVQRGKPDPQVFQIAAQRLDVAPPQCVVVEDAPVGIMAAHAAGMSGIGLASTGRTPEDLAAAEAVVGSLDEITTQLVRHLVARRLSSPAPSTPSKGTS